MGPQRSSAIADGLFGAHVVGTDKEEVIAQQAGNALLRPIVHGGFDHRPSDRRKSAPWR